MSDQTSIEWCDSTWNPVSGCTKISEGCTHCYIARTPPFRMAGRRFEHFAGPDRIGATTGVQLHPERLTQPLAWRRPRRIFVCSLADLFHDEVPDLHIARVFATMHLAGQHTFQVLTKRPARMRSLLTSHDFTLAVQAARTQAPRGQAPAGPLPWPLPNVWVGVSAETQQWADIRIPSLLVTPAAVRWVSAEPLLGPLDLTPWLNPAGACEQCDTACTGCPLDKAVILSEDYRVWADGKPIKPGPEIDAAFVAGRKLTDHQPIRHLDWVVAGGESGPGARPMRPEWAHDLRDQCADAGVAFLFKQWGEHGSDGRRVGKRAAGRTLDGRTHDEYPASRVESGASS